jgi:hypothetical protein
LEKIVIPKINCDGIRRIINVMYRNDIILEIENSIKGFDFNKLHKINEIKIINDTESILSIFIEFDYINYNENKKHYVLGIDFINVRINYEIGLDLINILNINKLKIQDISENQMEKINWEIIDEDDDGEILFKIYCEEIKIKYIE